MNDQDRQMLEAVLRTAGEAGQKGFGYLVHYTVTHAAMDIAGAALALTLVAFLAYRAWTWKIEDDDYNDEPKHVARIIGLVLSAFIGACLLGSLVDDAAILLAPEGAAIHDLVKHAK